VKVAVVIPVYNALAVTKETLDRFESTTTHNVGLVVVDDASDAITQSYLMGFVDRMKEDAPTSYVRHSRQQLFTRAVNHGWRYAYHNWHPESLVALNSDVELREGWLEGLLDAMRDPRVGLVGYPDNPDDNPAHRIYLEKRMPEYVTGHAFAIRTKMAEEIGILCETDTDGRQSPELAHLHGQAHIGSERVLCWRACMAGWRCLECWLPRTRHAAGTSWNHDLKWLQNFDLRPLWVPTDTLDEPEWYDEDEG
jgi:glycosyltransferase involved in cell wall biosynthesis